MSKFFKTVKAANIAVVILQFCVLGFQIYRWNEIVGSLFSIVVSLFGFAPIGAEERWFLTIYIVLIVVDFVFQLVNMIILICLQWTVNQFCINLNVAVEIPAGVSCNDWWHFGYGEINHRDRSLIVTVLLAVVILIRLVQIVLTFAAARRRSSKSIFFINREPRMMVPSLPVEQINRSSDSRIGRSNNGDQEESSVQRTKPTGILAPKNAFPKSPNTPGGPKVQPLPYQQRHPRPHSATVLS